MRVIVTILIFLVSATALIAEPTRFTERPESFPELKRNIIHFSPFRLFRGQLQVGYERVFEGPIKYGLLYQPSIVVGGTTGGNTFPQYGTLQEAHFKFYLVDNYRTTRAGRDMNFNFFVAPQVQFKALQFMDVYIIEEPVQVQLTEEFYTIDVGLGANYGIQFTWNEKMTLSYYHGFFLQQALASTNEDYLIMSTFTPGHSGLVFKSNFQFGFKF